MWNSARESRLYYLPYAFLWVGLTSGAACAFDNAPSPSGQPGNSESSKVLASEIAAQVEYWPVHCEELEAAKRNTDASRCWWYAAEELNRYVTGDHPLTEKVKELRRDWLWRGVRLSRQLLELKASAKAESRPIPPANTDPGTVEGAVSCASISSGDRAKCPAATPAVAATPGSLTPSRKKEAAIPKASKKKTAQAESANAKTSPVQKTRKKTILKPGAVRAAAAALPLIPQKKINYACPPTKPCVDHRLPAGSLR